MGRRAGHPEDGEEGDRRRRRDREGRGRVRQGRDDRQADRRAGEGHPDQRVSEEQQSTGIFVITGLFTAVFVCIL